MAKEDVREDGKNNIPVCHCGAPLAASRHEAKWWPRESSLWQADSLVEWMRTGVIALHAVLA